MLLAVAAPVVVWTARPPGVVADAYVSALDVDGTNAYIGGPGRVTAVDLRTGRTRWTVSAEGAFVRGVVALRGAQQVLTAEDGGAVRVRDAATGAVVKELGRLPSWPLAAAVSADERLAAVVGLRGELAVWTLPHGVPVPITWTGGAPTRLDSVAFDPRGGRLAVAGILAGAAPAGLIDLHTRVGRRLGAVGNQGFAVAFSPDGRQLALGRFGDGRLSVHAVDDDAALLWERVVSPSWAGPLGFGSQGLLVGTPEALWALDPRTGAPRASFRGDIRSIATWEERIAVVPWGETALRWLGPELVAGEDAAVGPVVGLAWSPDGARLAVLSTTGLTVRDASGGEVAAWPRACASPEGVRFDATAERVIAVACGAATIYPAAGGAPSPVAGAVGPNLEAWFDGPRVVVARYGEGVVVGALDGAAAIDPRTSDDPARRRAVWGHRSFVTQHWFHHAVVAHDPAVYGHGGLDVPGGALQFGTRGLERLVPGGVAPLDVDAVGLRCVASTPDGQGFAEGYADGRVVVFRFGE